MTKEEHRTLHALVRGTIQNMIDGGKAVEVDHLVAGLLKRYQVSGRDAALALACIRYVLKDLATREVRAWTKAGEDELDRPEQTKLPGYEHLQKAYCITREGVQLLVPISSLTDDEIDVKIGEHQKQAEGHLAHANELRVYKRNRAKP